MHAHYSTHKSFTLLRTLFGTVIALSLYLGQAQMWVTLPGLVEPVLDEARQVLTAGGQAAVAHNA